MKLIGRIIKTENDGDIVHIKVDKKSICASGCASCGACGDKSTVIQAVNTAGARHGDKVEIENKLLAGIAGKLPEVVGVI